MRTSAHPTCQYNYSYFKRTIPGKVKGTKVLQPDRVKIAILNESFGKSFK